MIVSLVIPTLNEEKYIKGCINSIRSQSMQPDEIIIVDSGSCDRTVEILKTLDVKMIHGLKSISYNRQKGVEEAMGDIIITTDADCIHHVNWIERIVAQFNHPDVAFVTGPTKPIVDESGFLDGVCYSIGNICMFLLSCFGENWSRGSNSAFRKKDMRDIGGYNTGLIAREDSDLSKRMKHKGRFIFDWGIIAFTSMRRRKAMGWLRTIRYFLDTPAHFITKKAYYQRTDDGM